MYNKCLNRDQVVGKAPRNVDDLLHGSSYYMTRKFLLGVYLIVHDSLHMTRPSLKQLDLPLQHFLHTEDFFHTRATFSLQILITSSYPLSFYIHAGHEVDLLSSPSVVASSHLISNHTIVQTGVIWSHLIFLRHFADVVMTLSGGRRRRSRILLSTSHGLLMFPYPEHS